MILYDKAILGSIEYVGNCQKHFNIPLDERCNYRDLIE